VYARFLQQFPPCGLNDCLIRFQMSRWLIPAGMSVDGFFNNQKVILRLYYASDSHMGFKHARSLMLTGNCLSYRRRFA
jgi:hypothetical protein